MEMNNYTKTNYNNYTKTTYNKNHYIDSKNVLKNRAKTFKKMLDSGELTEEQYNYNMRVVVQQRTMYSVNCNL